MTSTSTADRRSTAPGLRMAGPPLVWMLLAALVIGLTAFAWASPATAAAPEMRPYTVDYRFNYATPLPPNPVYEAPALEYGDAVFLSVVDRIDVQVAYAGGHDVTIDSGSLVVKVLAVSSAGWERELSRTAPVPVVEGSAAADTTVDFALARTVAAEIAATTGTSGELTVAVVAEAEVDGTLAQGSPLEDHTSSEMAFAVTANTASLTDAPKSPSRPSSAGSGDSSTGEAMGSTGAGAPSPMGGLATGFASRETGGGTSPGSGVSGDNQVTQMVPTDVARPNQVGLLVATVDVSLLRTLVTPLALLLTAAAVLSIYLVSRASKEGEVAYIAARHGGRLVAVDHMPENRVSSAVDLASFDALRAMSAELEQLIMVDTGSDTVAYYVTDGASTYRYRTTEAPAGSSPHAGIGTARDELAEDRTADASGRTTEP